MLSCTLYLVIIIPLYDMTQLVNYTIKKKLQFFRLQPGCHVTNQTFPRRE
jgi:hypothetical protein